jgi:syntaxin 1B/2/3
MQQYPQQGATTLPQNDFLNAVTRLRDDVDTFVENLQSLVPLRNASLADTDGGYSAQQLEAKDTEIRAQRQYIFSELKRLTDDASKTTDASKGVKQQQLNVTKNNFEKALRNYSAAEAAHRQKVQSQFERQYRIVNPSATEEEVQQAAASGNDGVFQQAVGFALQFKRTENNPLIWLKAPFEPHWTSNICTGQRSRSPQ